MHKLQALTAVIFYSYSWKLVTPLAAQLANVVATNFGYTCCSDQMCWLLHDRFYCGHVLSEPVTALLSLVCLLQLFGICVHPLMSFLAHPS